MTETTESEDERNARLLIQKNIEVIEARLERATRKGCDHPVALIYDLRGEIGRRLVDTVLKRAPHMASEFAEVLAKCEEGRLPWHLTIGDRLTVGDQLADALDGTLGHMPTLDRIVEMIATPHEADNYSVVAIAGQGKQAAIIGTVIEIGQPLNDHEEDNHDGAQPE